MKTGIVFEGGASRAYFSAGVMDALLDEEIYSDYAVGVSAGIANGVSYISRQRGRNYKVGTEYLPDKRYMGVKYLFDKTNRSLYNIKFVFGEVPETYVPFDLAMYEKFGGETYAGLTDMRSGKPAFVPAMTADNDWKNVVASCALPFLFQPVEIEGMLYMDGGISDPVPYEKAVEDGCDKVIVVLTRERDYIKKTDFSTKYAAKKNKKKYPAFAEALMNRAKIYNEQREELKRLEKSGKVFVIAPKNTTGWKRTEKRPEFIKEMYNNGYNEAKENIVKLKDYLA